VGPPTSSAIVLVVTGGETFLQPASTTPSQGLQIDTTSLANGSSGFFVNMPSGWTGNLMSANYNNGQIFAINQSGTAWFNGNVGIGSQIPQMKLEVMSNGPAVYASSGGSGWSGCFGSDCTGGTASQDGVYGNGSSYGVYGSNAGAGYAVLGESTGGWGGYFNGANGVYGQSTDGWAGEFYTTGGQNGVTIGNPWNNAQLCLNGSCVTSLTGNNVTLYQNIGNQNLGVHQFCALASYNCTQDCHIGVSPSGTAAPISWSTFNQGGASANNVICLN
jgi:hypothetical protein